MCRFPDWKDALILHPLSLKQMGISRLFQALPWSKIPPKSAQRSSRLLNSNKSGSLEPNMATLREFCGLRWPTFQNLTSDSWRYRIDESLRTWEINSRIWDHYKFVKCFTIWQNSWNDAALGSWILHNRGQHLWNQNQCKKICIPNMFFILFQNHAMPCVSWCCLRSFQPTT